jgi:class 3 adenylate cyclase/HAMP domain-containing protein
VEILKEAINTVSDGEQTTARMLLFSPRFDKHLDNMMQFVYALHNKVERQTSIRVERAEATAQIFSVLSLILLIVTTAVLLLMIVVFFGHKVVRPLAAITTSVDRLAAGQLDVPVPYQQEQTEIGAVARAITVFKGYSQRNESLLRETTAARKELADKSSMLEQLSNQLSKYLSPQVYESIFTGKQEVKIASRRKKLTIFFSDIVSFTETTDNLEAEELSNLLNHYLTEMSKIALEHGGTIDKYVGDAILIFFGDPESRGVKEDAKACVQMAIAMQRRMRELEQEWRDRGLERPLHIRIGINTGFCTVGNFGSQDRMDYTIIGNEVNLASRLESSVELGGILMAHETYSLVKDVVLAEEQPPLTVKGFDKPIHCHKVVGIYDDLEEEGRIVRHQKHGIQVFVDPDKLTGDDRGEAIEALKDALAKLED